MMSDYQWNPTEVQMNSDIKSMHVVNRESANESDLILANISSIYSSKELVEGLIANVHVNMVQSKDRSARIQPEKLSQKWMISLNQAQDTLKASTQNNIRQPIHSITRRFRTDMLSNRYRTLRDHFYSDTTFSRFKSLAGNTCAQIFCNKDFVWVYPMSTKGDAAEALQAFHEDIGVPTVMIVDGASELSKKNSKFYKRSRNSNTVIKTTEPYTPRQNFAETWIGWLKKRWRNRMRHNNVPPRLWDHGLRYEAEIMIRVARGVNKRTAYERITGETPDIRNGLIMTSMIGSIFGMSHQHQKILLLKGG